MRSHSLKEIAFRLRQELANAAQFVRPPALPAGLSATAPLPVLPDPQAVAVRLRNSPYAAGLEQLAEEILNHRFPLLSFVVSTGPHIDWRRDYVHDKHSGLAYFRRVPYLDFDAVGDHKIVWELSRHQHLIALAQAYSIHGKRAYLQEIQDQLRSWLQQNPYQQGIQWTSALEVAFRALSWIWVFHLTGNEFEPDLRRLFLDALYRHGCFLENNLSVYFSPNTHLLGEALALHALGVLFPQWPRAARWRATGSAWTRRQMEFQVRADGSHFEQSSYYHVYAADMFQFHALLDPEISPAYRERLGKMMDYLSALLGPHRAIPCFGDDDGGRFFHPYGEKAAFGRATLATASHLLARPYFYAAADLPEQAAWWLGPQVLDASPPSAPPSAADAHFSDAGISVAVRGDLHVVFKWGGFGWGGAGHSHADVLSLMIRLGNEELLIDPGTFTYSTDPAQRDWFRSVAAHNALRIDGLNQASPKTPYRWSAKPETFQIAPWNAAVRIAGFTHQRHIDFSQPGKLIVEDTVEGSASEHTIEQFWHTGASFETYARLRLDPHFQVQQGIGGEFGWHSPGYGTRVATPFIRGSWRGSLPARWITTIEFL